jgi:ketosteroid isomerase-like protein
MNNQEEKTTIENVLADYAQVLNTAKTDAIASFYTPDGVLFPEGVAKGLKPAQLAGTCIAFFTNNEFSISYALEAFSVDGPYAFVEAKAATSCKDLKSGNVTDKTSKDFFVLKQQEGAWKIYRYIFNTIA